MVTTTTESVLAKTTWPVYCYHGMEFSGVLNLQGGVDQKFIERVRVFNQMAHRGQLLSVDIPMPDYKSLILERSGGNNTLESLARLLPDNLPTKVPHLKYPHANPKRIVLGDSHALSQWTKGSVIIRLDGQTLHGALEKGLMNLIPFQLEDPSLETVTVYFGNIDLRHHLCRYPVDTTRTLVKRYIQQLNQLMNFGPMVEVVEPLFIENECRQLPKTGWYKGTPFFGSWEQRNDLRNVFIEELENFKGKIYRHPIHFLDASGQLYHIPIYDTVKRRYAGFSNVLEQLMVRRRSP